MNGTKSTPPLAAKDGVEEAAPIPSHAPAPLHCPICLGEGHTALVARSITVRSAITSFHLHKPMQVMFLSAHAQRAPLTTPQAGGIVTGALGYIATSGGAHCEVAVYPCLAWLLLCPSRGTPQHRQLETTRTWLSEVRGALG
eukprot:CAMPEP_0119479038 /NCGR_PEP_ID=MMETSP1344-20130328/8499_1 /TAXON_ID=236787 /ORGANISM="Florenciella parvula, Strain CCMP2471" /LENGTH=141 /DNA_ID=CAMNT_0007513251 /DNA_START=583 /DNA_END=1005 /DNA_ORIENTATION=+